MIGIYKIENKLNGKIYIGQALDIELRLQQHKDGIQCSYKTWYPEARKESNSIEDFDFSILQICKVEELDELEEYWIRFYDSYNNGYNKTLNGQIGNKGSKIINVENLPELSNTDFFHIMKDLNGNSFKFFLYYYLLKNKKDIPYLPATLQDIIGLGQKAPSLCLKELKEKNYIRTTKNDQQLILQVPFKS